MEMNQVPANSNNRVMPDAHNHAHRRAMYVVISLLGLIALGGILYQALVNGLLPWNNKKLIQEYNAQSYQQAAQFFKDNPVRPMTAAELKESNQFFKTYPASGVTFDEYQTQAAVVENAYQNGFKEWKATR